jgi:hypothetical protein
VRNPIRNETSLVLVVAVIFSAAAIPVLSGFLEPSQPPSVATVQIGDPRDRDSGDDRVPPTQVESNERGPAGDAQRQPSAQSRARSAQSRAQERATQPAPSAPADGAEDDGGEAD